MPTLESYIVNPGRRRRRSTRRRRASTRRRRRNPILSLAPMTNPRRRRRSGGGARRTSRRRYRSNPGFRLPGVGKVGVDIKGAVAGVAGMALAKFLVNKVQGMAPQVFTFAGEAHAGKVRGLAAMILGGMATKALPIPSGYKGPMALGAQIAGASMVLSEVAPQFFSGVDVPVTSALGAYYTPGSYAAAEWEPVADATL